MYGIFVNDNECPYASYIAWGIKTIETRSKNMLSALVGHRVAVVRTSNTCKPYIIGYVDIVRASRENSAFLSENRNKTRIPVGSKYDTPERWCYFLDNAETCLVYPLPKNAIRHGRSWCEWEEARPEC